MKTILKSPAKINLTLDILGQDEASGYHFVNSVMQEIPWIYDEIEIEVLEDLLDGETKIDFFCHSCGNRNLGLPTNKIPAFAGITVKDNTLWQAVEIMRRETGHLENVYIKVKKNIPMQSGLGGGSSNAAQVLKFLNKFWKLKKSRRILAQLGAEIGMDVPFFIYGGTALASHFGEIIEPLPNLKISENDLEIVFTDVNISTKEAYENLDLKKCGLKKQDTLNFLNDIKNDIKFKNLIKYFHNDFENTVLEKHPELRRFWAGQNDNVHLCGSGGAIFLLI